MKRDEVCFFDIKELGLECKIYLFELDIVYKLKV